MRSWIVEYRPKCGCTALKEPVDCGQGFRVYAGVEQQDKELEQLRVELDNQHQYCLGVIDSCDLARGSLEADIKQLRAKLDLAVESLDKACAIIVNNPKGSYRGEHAGSISAECYSFLRGALAKIKDRNDPS